MQINEYFTSWGTTDSADQFVQEEAEEIFEALQLWIDSTAHALGNPKVMLRSSLLSGVSDKDDLFEAAIRTSAPMSEAAQAEMFALRDVMVLIRMVEQTDETQDLTPTRDTVLNSDPTAVNKALDMLYSGENALTVARAMAS